DGTVRWWDLPSTTPHPLAHKGDGARELHFSRDGQRVLSTRGENVRVWTLPGTDPRKLRGATDEVIHALFTPDGDRVVTSALDGGVGIYRMGLGRHPAEPDPPAEEEKLRAWLEAVTNAVVQ